MTTNNEEVLKTLPNNAVRDAIKGIIENNIPYKDYSIHIEEGSAKGDNYIGIVHRISITYKDDEPNDSSKPQKLGIFLKVPPQNLVRREQFFARPCFLREALIYNEYLPLLVEFQKSKGIIPEENGFKEYAMCYKNLTDNLEEAILMEDLSLKGFQMYNRFENPTIDVVKVVMRSLGKLHALSFAIKDQWPSKFAKFKSLEEIFARKDDLFVNYINGLDEIAYNSLSNEGDEKYIEHIKELVKVKPIFDRMLDLIDGSRAEPYAVVCHGDCWNNNILFRYENGEAVDARLIDWQITRFASPACDLTYYIFSCTNKSLRDEYYEDIIDTYYSELENFLQRLGSDPTVLFPRTALDDQLKKFGSFAFVMGLMLIPTITSSGDDIPDLDELSERMQAGDEEYTKEAMKNNVPATSARIRDVIVDLVDRDMCI